MLSSDASLVLPPLLVAGLLVASWQDWRRREVDDLLWQLLAIPGAVLGAIALGTTDALPLALWALAAVFVLQHLFPWDAAFDAHHPEVPTYLEIAAYAGVTAFVAIAAVRYGVGPSTVPLPVISVLASTLVARALFEAGVLYGGADAKAIMVAGLLVPLFSPPLLPLPANATVLLPYYPYSLDLLMDAAILAAAIPIAIAIRNARRGQFQFPRGFTGYPIPVDRLADSFVWVRDPAVPAVEEDVETSEEDRENRLRQQAELRARGISEVWVTPQLPFIVLLAAGAIAALLAGNLVFDVAALL